MGALRFATGRRVTIPTAITGNAGTGLYSFRVRSGPAGITLPATGVAGFIGTSQATGSNGLATNPSGQLRVYRSGTNLYGSTTALITSGVQFDYTLTHLANGNWDIFNNLTGSATGQSGTYTQTQAWSGGVNALNQLGRSSNTNTVYLVGDMEIIAVTGLANAQEWQADLSGGTGLTLPTVSGTNNGTLDGFGATDADNWIGFTSAITSTINYDLGDFGFAASANVTAPVFTAAVDYDLGAFGFDVSASNSVPLVSADIAYSIGDFGFDVVADNLAPSGGATVNFSIGDFGFSVDASSSVPVVSAEAVFDLGDFGFAVVASIASNNESASVAFDLGSFGFAASASVINPPITATTAFDMGNFGFSIVAALAAELATETGSKAFQRLVASRIDVDAETGKVTVLNDDGSASSLDLAGLKAELGNDPSYAPLLKSGVVTFGGGNANGSQSGSASFAAGKFGGSRDERRQAIKAKFKLPE